MPLPYLKLVGRSVRAAMRSLLALAVAVALASIVTVGPARAEDASAPAILQIFEARWETIEDRLADIHAVGYGRMWVPPPQRAGSGFSVGYDAFDRFDLGTPGNETHYGTGYDFKQMVQSAHAAGVAVNPDLILNHNGVGNRNDPTFVALGGYPGLALTLPGDVDGDFHDPSIDALTEDQILGQLAGLNDIAQEKNHQFIRHPIGPDANNIPAGSVYNKPDPNNARFYPDLQLGGTMVWDPRRQENVTLYSFNEADPLAGDPVLENANAMLMRNVRWMIQEYDVDGFRLDAARHFPRWVLDSFDQAAYLAKRDPLLDGSPNHVYSFSETGFDSIDFIDDFIRKDINPNDLGQLGGNRDVLDFRLFNRLKDNLTGNGFANNWHGIRGESIDLADDGLMNGSQGVSFVQSHDEEGAFLENVAHAYTLMLPGNALVYLNAEEYGPTGTFPKPGKVDALGGNYGETIATLVGIRNSHGRGDFRERWIDEAFGDDNGNGQQESNIYVYERSNSAVVGLNSRNDSSNETRNGVQTDFAQDTILVELTGNADDGTVDPASTAKPYGEIRQTLRVNGSKQINLTIPSNEGHGRGYVIYGVATPQGTLSLTNVASTLQGATPSAANNGTDRLADVDVITADSFNVQLNTTPVSLQDPDLPSTGPLANPLATIRDVHADGDAALLKIDGGINVNGNSAVDHVTPGSVVYGFEEFTDVRSPGYLWENGANVGTGFGTYSQTIDATQLSEGRHYITVRAFRHRNAATGGDGGPAVYTDLTRTVYIDRVAPPAELVSFDPFASNPGNLNNRDLVFRSLDGTIDNMHIFFDLPAGVSDEDVMTMALNGQGLAGDYGDRFISGQFAVRTGNHSATIVSFEETGRSNIERFTGIFTQTNIGAGFGDLNGNGKYQINDILGASNGSLQQVLFSQDMLFNAAADLDGDGRVTTLDLIDLGDVLVTANASATVMNGYDQLLLLRGDVNQDGFTDALDVASLHASFNLAPEANSDTWYKDLNVDGVIDLADVETLVDQLVHTYRGDFNLDRRVDGADFLAWQRGVEGVRFDQGDANLSGVVGGIDLDVWKNDFSLTGPAVALSVSRPVPEPSAWTLCVFAALLAAVTCQFNHSRDGKLNENLS
jgi:glycosidase